MEILSTIKLPDMDVEKRESNTPHEIPTPNNSMDNLYHELQLAIQMNQDVHTAAWATPTLEILSQYIPVEDIQDNELVDSVMAVCGHKTWKDCALFVQDDMCAEFFNMALKYCLMEGQKHQKPKGFIDGTGIGYLKEYTKDLKVSLEKAFDAKYYYKLERPLEFALSQGMDLTRVANKIHPGHWSYPAGHGTKFFQAVKTLSNVFHLDRKVERTLMIAAGVEAMARTGNLIHYPMDNCAGLLIAE